MPFFSVVIITFNRAPMLRAAIDSALSQGFEDREVIVLDDGSTDETPAILASYGDQIRTHRQENAGIAAARNAAVAQARGQYCVFLDSDDLWMPWGLATLERAIRQTNFPAIIGLAYRSFTSTTELEGIEDGAIQLETAEDWLSGSNRFAFAMGTAHHCVRTREVRDAGGFDPNVPAGSDTDLFLRIGTAPGFTLIRAPVQFGYRRHDGSVTRDMEKVFQGSIKKIEHERAGLYAGGDERRRERLDQITVRLRAASVSLLKAGTTGQAWKLYWAALGWHLRLRRCRYIFAFPMMAAFPFLRRVSTARPRPFAPNATGTS